MAADHAAICSAITEWRVPIKMPAIKEERAAENKILSGCRGFAGLVCVSWSDKTGSREIIIYLATEFNEFVTRATLITPCKMSSGNDYRYGSIKLATRGSDLTIGIEAIRRDVWGGMRRETFRRDDKNLEILQRAKRIFFFSFLEIIPWHHISLRLILSNSNEWKAEDRRRGSGEGSGEKFWMKMSRLFHSNGNKGNFKRANTREENFSKIYLTSVVYQQLEFRKFF